MRARTTLLQRLGVALAMVPVIASAQPPTVSGPSDTAVAGGERFGIDASRVEEKRLSDGTVIVRLNGEGMEKIVLSDADGRLRPICASALERPLARRGVPADFRGRSDAKANDDAIAR